MVASLPVPGLCDNNVRVNRDLAERIILGDVQRRPADPGASRYVFEQMEQVLVQLNSDVPETIRSKPSWPRVALTTPKA